MIFKTMLGDDLNVNFDFGDIDLLFNYEPSILGPIFAGRFMAVEDTFRPQKLSSVNSVHLINGQ